MPRVVTPHMMGKRMAEYSLYFGFAPQPAMESPAMLDGFGELF
jgi:hypothetical protein